MPEIDGDAKPISGEDLDLLLDTARRAGVIAMEFFGQDPQVWMKGGTSPVSEADYAVDRFMRETLLEARPDYGWLSEETADDLSRLQKRRTFVVDPIDGTRAFLAGKSTWCVAVAIVETGRPVAGVLECPAEQETYWAAAGAGAFCNDKHIHVRQEAPHNIAGPKTLVERLPQTWLDQLELYGYVPSLAYRLALIAAGRLDASFVKPNSHDWDIAAADLILREAGGSLLDDRGQFPGYSEEKVRHGALCAGSGELLGAMADVLKGRPD
ncbi:3'(2'),5'-bisphosphate nucleotidase CysQ [Manganibacter manganicus]|uniref:3'(2'),5'-bisphosphate nucleotidase CysQ n=1 Tax=Manganibacter manganicus TaxID=1873176 RepID=A0A1V8RSA9_9HYPH|nr:3'(2'),5'-bisphosphate nucleotidase CysQ [Pseudaminobacter manganicus]OQM75889.1 3'(2'),5'-bisphosphate nucleotidase CysQ [Pseudaminobacter manganicus]